MSHFTVMVVTDTGNDEEIEKILQPFHEYECTGVDDKYVVHVDKTEEALSNTTRFVKLADGSIHDKYGNDPKFYHGTTFMLPEGAEEVQLECRNLPAATQISSIKSNYGIEQVIRHDQLNPVTDGYIKLAEDGSIESVFGYTNPNAKWDWWVIGGRWSGYFKAKPGAVGKVGKPGLLTDAADASDGVADIIRKDQIDLDAMRQEAEDRIRKNYREFMLCVVNSGIGEQRWTSWAELRTKAEANAERLGEKVNWDLLRESYHEQPPLKRLRADIDQRFPRGRAGWAWGIDDMLRPIDEAVAHARRTAIASYAFLDSSGWHEKGQMGWWGISTDEDEDWPERFADLFAAVPEDKYLCVVDCHI